VGYNAIADNKGLSSFV